MKGLVKTAERKEVEEEFSFKKLFVPLTTLKAIHWNIFIGLVVYTNMLFNGFVWDDIVFIVNNDIVHTINLPILFGHNLFNSSSFFRPIAALYFALVYTVFQGSVLPFHIFQLSIHISNAILLMIFLRKFFSSPVAWVLSLVFLIHPMQVESVSYISTIDDPLFFLFGINGILLLMSKKSSIKKFITTTVLFSLTLLTKETGILFLLFGLIHNVLYEKKKIITTLIISTISIGIYLLTRILSVGFAFASFNSVPIAQASFLQRIYTLPQVFLYYVKTFIFPLHMAIDQQWVIQHFSFGFTLLFLLSLSLLVWGAYFVYTREKRMFTPYLFFGLWFLGGMALLVQLFPLDMTVADRWFYLPMVGLLGLEGCIYTSMRCTKKVASVVTMIVVIGIGGLSLRTMIRNANWTDPYTLYSHDVLYTNSFDLESNLSAELESKGDHVDAFIHAQKSVSLYPGEINQNNLALLYQSRGNTVMAKKYFVQSFDPIYEKRYANRHDPSAYVNYVRFLATTDTPQNALQVIHTALSEYPNLAELWIYKAISEYRLHQYDNAIKSITTAYTHYPSQDILYIAKQIEAKKPISIITTYDGKPKELE